ncbi:hypothetical protein VNO77_16967 [Canavalia gladiata]|uniref:Uncharacterized protein n=1 Tax=Canavalia gladiata TaxID=3824 RepID=A0AAN9QIZ2_CANGL
MLFLIALSHFHFLTTTYPFLRVSQPISSSPQKNLLLKSPGISVRSSTLLSHNTGDTATNPGSRKQRASDFGVLRRSIEKLCC